MYQPQKLAVALAAALLLPLVSWTAPALAFELVSPQEEKSITVVVGSGQLIKVDGDFSSLFVANPDVADVEVKSPRLLYLTGTGVGETTLFAVDSNDNVLMSADIHVTHNIAAIQQGIARVAPGQSVTATTVDQSLVVAGSVATPQQAADVMQVATQFVDDPARVVNRMTVAAPTQVNLQVRIAEISRTVDHQLGIKWGAIGVNTGGSLQLGFVGGKTTRRRILDDAQLLRPHVSIDLLLQALSEDGLVSILAEPNLTARSGESASFLAGGEYPYAVAQDGGQNTITFKDYGIGLNFTPTVLDGNRISLRVATQVSDLSFADKSSIPSLITRRAETTVDLASGQSFAIAGLMQNTASQNASKMPGLGSVPVLGALFSSTGFKRGQTELVIIVTPIVVKPTTGNRIATPVDAYVPPNDFERILLGRFQGNSRQDRAGPQPDRSAPAAGFVRLRLQVKRERSEMATAPRTSSRGLTAPVVLALAALGLAACNTPPVAPASTQILPYGDAASFSFTFLPNSSNLVAGEAGRLRRFVDGLIRRPATASMSLFPRPARRTWTRSAAGWRATP